MRAIVRARDARREATARGDGVARSDRVAMTRTPRGLRSIKYRLALLFFAITFVALAVVYVFVTPTLGTGLRAQKLRTLQIAAQAYSRRLQGAIAGDERPRANWRARCTTRRRSPTTG